MPAREYTDSRVVADSRQYAVDRGFAVDRQAVQTAVWSPLDIADCALWLDASQIVGLGNGEDVSAWDDLSGNARHATQAVAAKKPHYKAAYKNGLGAVEFDGSNHWMSVDFSTPVSSDDHTVIVALETQGTAILGDQRILDFFTGRLVISSVIDIVGRVGYWETNFINAAAATDAAQVLTWQLDNAGAELFRDGVSIADSLPLVNRPLGGEVGLCSDYNGDQYLLKGVTFEILIYSPMLNATNRATIENYLIAKWGI